MKLVNQTASLAKRQSLRQEQSQLTRTRIEDALMDLLNQEGAVDSITFKAVAQRAGVTEMTVYRYFPSRDDLLGGLWERLNREMGPNVRMPENADGLLAQHEELFEGFDQIAPQIIASITTPQGRAMRASLNRRRRKAFLGIVDEIAPQLNDAERARAAAVIQLLHSAYAWVSMREQWGLSGTEAGEATRWAIEVLMNNMRRKK